MYRLLVIDDEDIITDSLANMLESASQFELDVYKAYSAAEALEYLNRTAFDIVITDIQMPGISGIELLKIIHADWPECQVIILTGYDEFQYASRAVQYHAARYILKNDGYEVLLEAIGACAAEIDKAAYNTEVLAKAEEQIQRYLPLMRQSLLQSLLSGDSSATERAGDFKRLDISLDPESPCLLLAARLSVTAKTEIVTSINVVIREKTGHVINSEISWVGTNIILWLIQPRLAGNFTRAQAAVKGMAENVQRFCMNVLNVKLSFVFNPHAIPWHDLAGHFSQLKFVITHRLEQQSDIALAELDFFLDKPPGEKTQDDRFVIRYKDLLKKLALCMSLDDLEGMYKIAAELSSLFSVADIMEFLTMELSTSLNLILLSYITQKGLAEQLKEDYSIRLFLSGAEMQSSARRIQQFSQIAGRLLSANKQEHKQSGDALANRILSYIHGNLSADLSLFALSEKVFLNPSYLSRRFKEITGKNITDTVAEIRIEEACRLLREGTYRVNQIAAMVGYDSAAYFSKFFKRKTGSNPQEYRDGL